MVKITKIAALEMIPLYKKKIGTSLLSSTFHTFS